MTYDEMEKGLQEARRTMAVADNMATELARTLVGRLRHVNSSWVLGELKKELQGFNRHTGRWA